MPRETADSNVDPNTEPDADAGAAPADPVVLVVDDEIRITQAFQLWLGDDYDVRTATSGEEAFGKLDDEVDVVLLDRQMPGFSGREVLTHIREADYDCRVAMVTGVDPDFDIVDMPFDDYVQKPVDRQELRGVVDRLLALNAYETRIRDYFTDAGTQISLEAEKSGAVLDDSDAYDELLAQLDQHDDQLRAALQQLDAEQIHALVQNLVDDVDQLEPVSEE